MISFIIPCKNEEENLQNLYIELDKYVLNKNSDYEIIFINDGSTDNTLKELKQLKNKDEKIKIISFNKNFGKTQSLIEGFELSKGDIICMLDADLQDHPSEIPKLLDKINEGYDLASGWRSKRKDSLTKKISSFLFNKFVDLMFKESFNDLNCGLKICRREVIETLNLYGEMHRFLPLLAKLKGFTTIEVEIKHYERKFGESKYGFERIFSAIYGVLTLLFLYKFADKPLYFFGSAGTLLSGTGLSFFLFYEFRKIFFGIPIGPGRPFITFILILIVLGFQLITIGLIGEMITYYFMKKEKPKIFKEIM